MHYLPMKIVDVAAIERLRIQRLLADYQTSVTDLQAEALRIYFGPLPVSDEELFLKLVSVLEVDSDKVPQIEERLRELAEDHRLCVDAGDDVHRKRLERVMLFWTSGMEEHPDWWQLPCYCHTCRSYA